MNKSIAVWWQACRFHFVPPSIIPAVLGSIIAWTTTGTFHPGLFLLTVIGVTFNHVALNMTDDYFDYTNSVDRAKNREKNPYSGGSGTLTTGLIKPRQMYIVLMSLYIITIIIGLYLTYSRGWVVLLLGLFGMASAYFYTAPPIRYGYHGFGELSQLINFSLTIGLGAYYVQAQQFSWEAFWMLLPLGFMMFSMITINEIPDEAQDREGNKCTLVVIMGKATGVKLYTAGMIIAFIIILLTPVFGSASYWSYLALLTLPWLRNAIPIANKHYDNPEELAPANMLTIKIHNIAGILLIAGYFIKGVFSGQDAATLGWLILAIIVLYTPVFFTIFIPKLPIKAAEKYIES
ncbi:1,4-dihydroxy-2-naphthoate octaprenyltransferase [candidate division KSB1 bacterium]|nr:1,4-dihydroxy-2-naphthoate octaprenyltransferase [candidate division KSB1 bacterium]